MNKQNTDRKKSDHKLLLNEAWVNRRAGASQIPAIIPCTISLELSHV